MLNKCLLNEWMTPSNGFWNEVWLFTKLPWKQKALSASPEAAGGIREEGHSSLGTERPKIRVMETARLFVCLIVFRATPEANGGSQARGRIGAVAAGLCHSHSNTRSKWPQRPTLQQCQILNPLSGTRDWTHVLMNTSWVCYHWTTAGTLLLSHLKEGFIVSTKHDIIMD